MCTKCYKSYGRGGWTKDGEGNDEYCRWCSEGGQIYLCDYCPQAFCNKCLRWNLGRKYLKKLEDEDKWKCLKCDPSPLREQRAHYWAITRFHKVEFFFSTPICLNTPWSGEVECQDGKGSSSQPWQSRHSEERREDWRSSEQWVASPEWKRFQCCSWGENVPCCSENVNHSQHCGFVAGDIPSRKHWDKNYTTPQANQAISVGPVTSPHSPKVNGVHKLASPQKPHFLDASFIETEVFSF